MFGRYKLAGLAGILLLANVSCSNSARFVPQEESSYKTTQTPSQTLDFMSIFRVELASLREVKEELDNAYQRKDEGLSYESRREYIARQIIILEAFPERVRLIKETNPNTIISSTFIPDAWERQVGSLKNRYNSIYSSK